VKTVGDKVESFSVTGVKPGFNNHEENGQSAFETITEKSFPGKWKIYVVMNSKHIRADICFAWPTAEFAVMGPDAAVPIIQRREIEAADDPAAKRQELIDEYSEAFLNPWVAAERGYIDDVIEPNQTRPMLIRHLEMLRSKRESLPQRKHGNIPL
jgi:acetyl-CoA carboxylase carboxyltransferase component